MKKSTKIVLLLSGIIAIPNIINRVNFMIRSVPSRPSNEEQFYKWRYGQIRYVVKGSGEPLLLIHGVYPGADMSEWKRVSPSLFRNHRVYTIDLLGFGRSDKPNMSYSAYTFTTMINDFIRDIIGQSVIVAASDYSAAYAIMGYCFDPTLFKKFLLIAPAGINKGFSLPTLRNLVAKWFLELPFIGTSAYMFITNSPVGPQLFKVLRAGDNIASNMPYNLNATAFVGGPNTRMPIAALLCKFLNVNIKPKLNKMRLPVLILSREHYGLPNKLMTHRLKQFLNFNNIN
ncbi:MAG: alpha/beta fold hydrolase [Clostridiales bacterium]|jgi:pimeloyl-ACP methyl ester carboxylesterase|nr:alpha/beta fold hydrolase [Clostridiales bacterium]